jgi:hypothetical protein
MANLAPLILKQIEGQSGSFHKEQGRVTIFNETKLPIMQVVTDWDISATEQWSKEELEAIRDCSVPDLINALAEKQDSWLNMGVISELVMHGNEAKAIEFTQMLLQVTPEAEKPLEELFGRGVMTSLKSPPVK